MGASQCTLLERLSLSNNRITDDSIGVLAANWLRDEPLRIASFTRTKTIFRQYRFQRRIEERLESSSCPRRNLLLY